MPSLVFVHYLHKVLYNNGQTENRCLSARPHIPMLVVTNNLAMRVQTEDLA